MCSILGLIILITRRLTTIAVSIDQMLTKVPGMVPSTLNVGVNLSSPQACTIGTVLPKRKRRYRVVKELAKLSYSVSLTLVQVLTQFTTGDGKLSLLMCHGNAWLILQEKQIFLQIG